MILDIIERIIGKIKQHVIPLNGFSEILYYNGQLAVESGKIEAL